MSAHSLLLGLSSAAIANTTTAKLHSTDAPAGRICKPAGAVHTERPAEKAASKEGAPATAHPPEKVLRSGFMALDAILPNGGVPRGAITEIACPQGLAKSTSIALMLCAAAQAEAKLRGEPSAWCAFLDPTRSLSALGAQLAGVDGSHLLVVRPSSEALARVAIQMAKSHLFSVVVIDTVGVPGALLSGSLTGWSASTRRIALAVEGSQSAVLLVTDCDAERPLPLSVALRLEVRQPASDRISIRIASDRKGQRAAWRALAWTRGEQAKYQKDLA